MLEGFTLGAFLGSWLVSCCWLARLDAIYTEQAADVRSTLNQALNRHIDEHR